MVASPSLRTKLQDYLWFTMPASRRGVTKMTGCTTHKGLNSPHVSWRIRLESTSLQPQCIVPHTRKGNALDRHPSSSLQLDKPHTKIGLDRPYQKDNNSHHVSNRNHPRLFIKVCSPCPTLASKVHTLESEH